MDTNTTDILSQVDELKAAVISLRSSLIVSIQTLRQEDAVVLAEFYQHNTSSARSQSNTVSILSDIVRRVEQVESKIVEQTSEYSRVLSDMKIAIETYQNYFGSCSVNGEVLIGTSVEARQPSAANRKIAAIDLKLGITCARLRSLEEIVSKFTKPTEHAANARVALLEARINSLDRVISEIRGVCVPNV